MRRHPDPDAIRTEVRATYGALPADPAGEFPYPTGRAGALALGYDAAQLDALPAEWVAAFVGVGNPLSLGEVAPGMRVLDVGCGAGVDATLAAHRVGARGMSVGIDLTESMLRRALRALAAPPDGAGSGTRGGPAAEVGAPRAPRLAVAAAESLPFADAGFDVVHSNGAMNLSPDKPRAFAEILRVLRPGGAFLLADIVRREGVPASVAARAGTWSA